MKILVAPDKFKECLTAAEAVSALAEAASRVFPGAEITRLPLADGGDGFAEILVNAAGGAWEELPVTGPYGEPHTGRIGWVDASKIPAGATATLDIRAYGKIAVFDAASVCGLALASRESRDPFKATSRGVGEMLARAAERGATAVILGLGGVATNDLGLGALEKVGIELTHPEKGFLKKTTPTDWSKETRVGGYLWPNIPDVRLACDVTNPLLGPNGATYAYGPQKGLSPEGVNELERLAGVMAKKLCDFCEKPRTLMATPGAGAAGGLAFGLQCAFDARITSGAKLIAEWLELENRIREADLVITGEGSFDLSSLSGKMPSLVISLAAKHGKPVVIVAGRVETNAAESLMKQCPKAHVVAASHPDWSLAEAREHATEAFALALKEAAAQL
jgi:glycerate kinase